MSLWDKINTQNKIDSSLLTELSDISYKSTKGKQERPRNLKEGLVDLAKMPFEVNPPQDKITVEMRTTKRPCNRCCNAYYILSTRC